MASLLPKIKSPSSHKGQSLVELLIAMGLTSILLPALLTGLVTSREGRPQTIQRVYAAGLLREASEALRSVRDAAWANVATNGTYHPAVSGSVWTLVSGTRTVDGYTRSINIADAYRDSVTGNLVTSGGIVDPSTKLITVTVSWTTPYPSSVSSTYYITRYRDNLAYIQTSVADFDTGTHTGTTVENSAGGEVVLGSGGQGTWCEPNLSITALDLPKNGVANALTAIEGQAFAGTGDNASGVSFAEVTINNTNPPSATIDGTFNGYKTNDVFGETGYAYLATDTNAKEIVIVNLANPLSEAGYFDASGPQQAGAVFASGSVGYMTQGSTLRTFDLTGHDGSRAQLGSISLAGTGTEIEVIGTYAYVSVDSTSAQLQIIDVTNPSSMIVVGQASVSGRGGMDVFVNSTATRAYLATAESDTQSEFFVIDVSAKTGSRPTLGSYDSQGMSPKGVTVVTGNKAILVGTGAQEYQVINIANESSPAACGGLNIDTGVNGVASVVEADGDAYSYIITGDAGAEFKIIEGGPGGQFASDGVYESASFDPGVSTAFNRLFFTVSEPGQTDVRFQTAVADAVSGSCDGAGFVFVGPDGTSATFFDAAGAIPLDDDDIGYENPGRCFRYRAYLSTSDPTQTPIFSDITINYSP